VRILACTTNQATTATEIGQSPRHVDLGRVGNLSPAHGIFANLTRNTTVQHAFTAPP